MGTKWNDRLRRLLWVLLGLCAYCGIGYVWFWPIVVAYRQATEGVATQATVQGKKYMKGDPESIDYWKYDLEYDGHHGTLTARRSYQPGTKVSVVYLEGDPDRVVLGTAKDSWWQLYVSPYVSSKGYESEALAVCLIYLVVMLALVPLLAFIRPQVAGLQEGDQRIVGEVIVGAEEQPTPDTEAPAWKCPQCGETVPGTFDVCWKCLTTKDGEKPDQQDSEFLQRIAEANEDDKEDEPTDCSCQSKPAAEPPLWQAMLFWVPFGLAIVGGFAYQTTQEFAKQNRLSSQGRAATAKVVSLKHEASVAHDGGHSSNLNYSSTYEIEYDGHRGKLHSFDGGPSFGIFAAQQNCPASAQMNCLTTWKEEDAFLLPSSAFRI